MSLVGLVVGSLEIIEEVGGGVGYWWVRLEWWRKLEIRGWIGFIFI